MIGLNNVSYVYPFQSRKALDSISLQVEAGETVLCTGASGCGKSTLIRLLNGLAPHYFHGSVTGEVRIHGRDNATRSIAEIAEDVGTLFQDPENQFFALNVEDELAFAHECRGVERAEIRRRVGQAMEAFSLQPLAGSSVLTLSEGEKQKVALASLISRAPRILVLDEPTANLDPEATRDTAALLARLKRAGMTLFIVDHRLYWLRDLVDQVVVLENGRVATTGGFSVLDDEHVRARFGLRQTLVPDPRGELPLPTPDPGDALVVREIDFAYARGRHLFRSAGARLPRGEVTALTGPNGSGKTTLARILTGLETLRSGTIRLGGSPLTPGRLLKRSSLVLQNTDHQLYMRTVREELMMSARGMPRADRSRRAEEMLETFRLDPLACRHPQSLSGGEKQRLVVACAAMKGPEVLILDEPSSGLDADCMRILADLLRRLAAEGACVLLITHDLELMERACRYGLPLPLVNGPSSPDTPVPVSESEEGRQTLTEVKGGRTILGEADTGRRRLQRFPFPRTEDQQIRRKPP